MGEFGFGCGFDMVKKGKIDYVIEMLELGVILIMVLGNVFYIMFLFVGLFNLIIFFERWIIEIFEKCVKEGFLGCVERDIFLYLLGEEKVIG